MTENIVSRALSKRDHGNASTILQREVRCGSILSKKSAACFMRLWSGANTIAERVQWRCEGGPISWRGTVSGCRTPRLEISMSF